jgi:hypothetical protein
MVSFHVPKEDYTPARQRQLGAVAYLVVVVGLGDDIKCLDKLGLSVSRVTTEGNAPLKPVNQNPYGHSQFESCRDYNALQVEGKPEEYVLLAVNGSSSNLPQNGRLLVVKHWKNVKDALVGESIERSIQPYARAGHAIAAALLAYVLIRLIVAAHTVGG